MGAGNSAVVVDLPRLRADPVLVYRILYRFLVSGWSAKPLVSAHDRIMGTHTPSVIALKDYVSGLTS